MSLLDQNFKYTNAAATAKPGYLRKRFQKIQRELREQQEREQERQRICQQCQLMESK